jgi:multidrug efflux system outer membrane protein
MGPEYKRPPLDAPRTFRSETRAAAASLGDLPWWRVFKDDALQQLIGVAVTNNYDLRVAVTRVEQARALAAQSRAELFPQANYEAGLGRGKNSANGTPIKTDKTASFFLIAGTVSWEIDLWGRIRRLNEAARAEYFASQEAQRAVRISIVSQVAQGYFELLALDAQLAIAREATNAFAITLKIFQDRLEHGVASRLETASAEALQASAAATIPDLQRRVALQENQINLLLGRYAGAVPRERRHPAGEPSRSASRRQDAGALGAGESASSLFARFSPPDIPPGLPSSLLERRPDILQAEQQLRAANAKIGVAKANFFPRLSLTGLLGEVSPEVSALTSGAGNAWSAAANLAGPIFQGGRLIAQLQQARAVREQYWLQYQAAVLTAFREVSDALISRQRYAEARLQQERAVKAYRDAVQVAFQRYQAGQSSYYEVLLEQQQLFPAENAIVQAELNQMLSVVELYRALGGGWEMEGKK